MQFSTLKISWRNLGRSKRRTALALLAIGVGQFALLATQGLMRGYADNIQRAITGPLIGHVQVHAPDWRDERAIDLTIRDLDETVEIISNQPEVEAVAGRIYAPALVAPVQEAYTAMVVGIEVDKEIGEYGLLPEQLSGLGEYEVLVGERLARKANIEVGQEIAIVGTAADGSLANDLFIVKSIVRTRVDMVNQSGVIMNIQDAQRLFVMPDEANEIIVRGSSSTDAEQIVKELNTLAILSDMEIKTWRELSPELVLIIDMADYIGYFVLILVFIAAIAGITNTLMMSTFERMHEFGMLLALGTSPWRLVRMIGYEAVFMGILGVLLGTILGYGFVGTYGETGIDMASWGGDNVEDLAYGGINLPLKVYPRIEISDPLLGLVSIMFISLLAAIWPATVAAKLEPMEAMRK